MNLSNTMQYRRKTKQTSRKASVKNCPGALKTLSRNGSCWAPMAEDSGCQRPTCGAEMKGCVLFVPHALVLIYLIYKTYVYVMFDTSGCLVAVGPSSVSLGKVSGTGSCDLYDTHRMVPSGHKTAAKRSGHQTCRQTCACVHVCREQMTKNVFFYVRKCTTVLKSTEL